MSPLRICRLGLLLLVLLPLALTAQRRGKPRPLPGRKPAEYGIRSKKAAEAYEQGAVAIGYGDYREAIMHLDRALALEPDFDLARYKKGEAQYTAAMRNQSNHVLYQRYLAELVTNLAPVAERNPKFQPPLRELFFFLGQAYMAAGEYDRAQAAFSTYLTGTNLLAPNLAAARRDLARASFAAEAMRHPVRFEPKNLGPNVNTPGEEYMAYPNADESILFFTSRRPESGLSTDTRYTYTEDFYFSRRQPDGSYGPAENLGPPVNTPDNEGSSCISPDGQFVFFTACNRKDGRGSCDLYVARLNGTQWSTPRNLGPKVNSTAWESHPCISHDGNTLYFVSSRPGGQGKNDIWYCEWDEEAADWGPAQNMGPVINTPGYEYGPFLHADGVSFYFSSDTHQGFGGQDLFRSQRQADGSWGKPVNLGYPLNTPANEQNLSINSAGTHAYLNSDARSDSYGRNDLYVFELDPAIRPRFATFVRGIVRDSLTRKPIGGALVQFIDLHSGDTVRSTQANDATGRFLLSLPAGRNYAAFAEAQGYLFNSQYFELRDLPAQPDQDQSRYYDLDIALMPIRAGATAVLRNVFFEFDSVALLPESRVELRRLTRFLARYPNLRIEIGGHTDDQGSDAYNLDLSRRRAQAVRAFLVAEGVAAARLTAKGYGETAPVAPNTTEASRRNNRRTEFKVLN